MKIVLFILLRKYFLPRKKITYRSERRFLVPLLIDPLIDVRTKRRAPNKRLKNGDQSPVEISMDVGCQREKNVFHRGRNVFMGCARTSAHAKTAEQA